MTPDPLSAAKAGRPRHYGRARMSGAPAMTLEEFKGKLRAATARMGIGPGNRHWRHYSESGHRATGPTLQDRATGPTLQDSGHRPDATGLTLQDWREHLKVRELRMAELNGAALSAEDRAVLERQGLG
jgi:hypothetical protein